MNTTTPDSTPQAGLQQAASDFEMQAVSQVASPLMRLPAELRLKILRNLLKNDGPRDPVPELANQYQTTDRMTELSSQVLACCQRLLHEARAVLYHENTIPIRCEMPTSRDLQRPPTFPIKCGILGAKEVFFAETLEHLPEARDWKWCSPDDPSYTFVYLNFLEQTQTHHLSSDFDTLKKHYHALNKIEKVHITVQYEKGPEMFSVCRVLQDFLKDKRVVFVPELITISSRPRTRSLQQHELNALKACQMLRCRSIEFRTEHPQDLRQIITTITSQEPVADLFTLHHKMRTLGNSLPNYNDDEYIWGDQEWSKLWNPFHTAILQMEAEDARELVAPLLQRATEWNEYILEEKKEAAREVYERTMAEIEAGERAYYAARDSVLSGE
ncbi:hypothetical protein OHC33_005839 [Knufia fluminis]|uniref:Uncharacterized protein n=1 Tax=Knufia fluminis TaxID=191047 RepID=A0AAN8I7H5_9EURO|nr:hypothetical protein OHC33_005839 [Knufia fluminis]